ncbi:protoheme IX farnesyltransferase [Candidatus Harpocratesius sp.]
MNIKKIAWIYSELIKWKQTLLLVYTSIMAYFISIGANSIIISDLLFLFVSMFLTISGTTILNMYIDYDVDKLMERTKNRPIPSGQIPLKIVLINGIIITIIGLIFAFVFLDWLTGFLIFLGFFFDFFIYSIWLKRRTKWSIIFGGIAGGLPAMAGRVLAIKNIDFVSICFLLFILSWIPVHILTLALFPHNLKGYRDAKIPMWPVVSSEKETMRVIAGSTFVNAVVIFLMALFLETNLIILSCIGIFCIILVSMVVDDLIFPSQKKTFRLFKFASIFMLGGFLLLYIGV